MNDRRLILIVFLGIGIGSLVLAAVGLKPYPSRADVVIFSPHPDDSVLCCAGVIERSLAEHKRVLVVNITNGDAYPLAASRLFAKPEKQLTPKDMIRLAIVRQKEDINALNTLGLDTQNIIYLAYPDGGLPVLYQRDTKPYVNLYTQKYATYRAAIRDYHSSISPIPAVYTKPYAVADISEIIRRAKPTEIYTTGDHDTAPDHAVVYLLVRDAIAQVGYTGKLFTTVIHAPSWPSPDAITPRQAFLPIDIAYGLWQSTGLPWPPPVRIPMTTQQAEKKRIALSKYRTQLIPGELPLSSFVKNEEIFWP